MLTHAETTAAVPSGLKWTDIRYDIPSRSHSERKAAANTPDVEKDSDVTPSSTGTAPLKPGYRRLLRGVSGAVKQGEYLGILGASGAGKTTLLNVLSARLGKLGELQGEVLYNGAKRDPTTWKRTVGYVEQDDAMLPRGTVRETVKYASKLRLPSCEFSQDDKARRVEDTLKMLRLEDCAETRIGSAVERGVSGGERKRASIATVSTYARAQSSHLAAKNG
jgi:ABC-type multidrug transport system ATPase subunit